MRKRDSFFVEADKGNKVLIKDNRHYLKRVNKLIYTGRSRKLDKNHLTKLSRQAPNVVNSCHNIATQKINHNPIQCYPEGTFTQDL